MKSQVFIILATLLLTAPAGATLIEFDQAVHSQSVELTGDFAAAVMQADGTRRPDNNFTLQAEKAILRVAQAETYLASEYGPAFSGAANHYNVTYHNVTLRAEPRQQTVYTGYHNIGHADIQLASHVLRTTATNQDVHDDTWYLELKDPRSTDVTHSLEADSSNHLEATIEGGVSINAWGWRIMVWSDEGYHEYSTGHERAWSIRGAANVGSASQIQIESMDAEVRVGGVYGERQAVWVRQAVVENDQLTVEVAGQDAAFFKDRTKVEVKQVTDTVTAEVLAVPKQQQAVASPGDWEHVPAWSVVVAVAVIAAGLTGVAVARGRLVCSTVKHLGNAGIVSETLAGNEPGRMRVANSHKFTVRVRDKAVQTRLHGMAVLRRQTVGELLEDLMDDA